MQYIICRGTLSPARQAAKEAEKLMAISAAGHPNGANCQCHTSSTGAA